MREKCNGAVRYFQAKRDDSDKTLRSLVVKIQLSSDPINGDISIKEQAIIEIDGTTVV